MDSDHVDLDASGVGDSKEEESSSSKGGLHERSFNQGYYDRFFVEESKLGRGQRGSVFLCQHVLDQVPLGQFAVKAIPVGSSHTWLVRMLKEVHLLERLRHPNIIEYKHAWLEHRQLTKFGPEIPCLFILMELANGGNLEEFVQIQWQPASVASAASSDEDEFSDMSRYSPKERIKRLRNRQRRRQQRQQEQQSASYHQQVACATSPDLKTEISSLTSPSANMSNGKSVADTQGGIGKGYLGKKVRFLREDEIWALFLDICNGLAHLHKHGIVHRDLKPPNLLLHYADPNERDEIPRVLISDFGECEVVSDTTYRERTGATGTLEFMPPELLLKSPTGQYVCTDHSPKADMWSLGVVLYFLCFARVPYTQVEDVDQLKEEIVGFDRIGELPETPRVGEGLRRCIKGLLKRDPRERWSVEQVLAQHSVDRTANIGRSRPGDSPMAGMSKAFDEPAERQLRTVVRKLTLEDVKAQATPFPSAETDGFS
ncbi:kinase-like domain-containing protein [Phlyctochytrium arcticum]|nr:kinase-like domain-containing protein [Phlyctochytrium arcticum]